jgi:hypothetical protein
MPGSSAFPEQQAKSGDASGGNASASHDTDAETRMFLESLKASGKLLEVDFGIDISQLPSSVTHVQYPDGEVKRVSFS